MHLINLLLLNECIPHFSEDKYLDDLKKLNNKPDIIIVAMHFGDEYKSMPTKQITKRLVLQKKGKLQ